MSRLPLCLAVLAALLTLRPALAGEPCVPTRAASMAMSTDDSGGVYVPMTIGTRKVNLLIDTGGIDSMLTVATVQSFNLPVGRVRGVRVTMFGGVPIEYLTEASNINLGGLFALKKQFLVLPNVMPPGIDGTLAPDVLRAYDDDFDFANSKFNLYLPNDCTAADVVYWTKSGYSALDIQLDDSGQVMMQVTLDGQKFRAHIDTGSSRSVLGLDEARNLFHFDMDSPLLKPLDEKGVGHSYKFPFKTLNFGGTIVNDPDIVLVPERDSGMTGALIGMGVLRQLHIYIAYQQQKMYISPATAH